ncbi:copper resistance CopC family protein [Peribacillus frigoritolerans]|uniref:copper resistance CopC family protein n=1 Tax=Peribacillus frigoritolerans TaxID=450367 RepID=UPI0007BFBD33|nr:copper resistance CopC family protein [Peribacillus frigoritolerans]USK67238.1 copper resistance protein CopC [Peribacillus frigoritolerans]
MRKLLFMLMCMFISISIPTIANAHTELSSSSPKEGEMVTEELDEIVLDFAGAIEELSTMKLMKDGEEVSLSQVQVQDKKMVGTPSAPLENGSYIIDWTIAGEDGHPISGKVSFSVQIEDMHEEKEAAQSKAANIENEQQDKGEVEKENQTSSNPVTTIITVLLFVILGLGLVLLFRKKRK